MPCNVHALPPAHLDAQTLGDVRTRLAASLMGQLAEAAGGIVDVPRPQAEWAEDLGTVREVLARELKRLLAMGLIQRVDRGRIRILDEEGLEALACAAPPVSPSS